MAREKRSKESSHFDAIVVGGGVIGLAIAWSAARKGLEICVIERALPGSGASSVAAGMLAPVGEAEFGESALLDLNLASHTLWPDFSAALERASETGFLPLGALHAAFDDDEAAELRRQADLHQRCGLESTWLDRDSCRELEPGLAPSVVGGLSVPGDAAADPRQLVEALSRACASAGVEIRSGVHPIRAVFGADSVSLELSDGDNRKAERLVLASGAWSGERADWLDPHLRAPVRPVKGQILELAASNDSAESVCSRIVCGERFYAVPRSDGRLALGATVEEKGFDLTVTAGAVHELLREGYRALPEIAEMELVETRAGLRPATPDNAPLIGPHPEQDRLVFATGHFRNGILLAPLTGELVAADLSGGDRSAIAPGVDLTAFAADRFADRFGTVGVEVS